VFDFVGLNEVTTQALEMLTVGGALYLIGVAGPDSQVTVNLVSAVLRQPRVVGVNTGSSNFKRDIPLYSRMYLDGRFELDALVSAEISLDQIESGYQKLANPKSPGSLSPDSESSNARAPCCTKAASRHDTASRNKLVLRRD
jgi:S-(hydroxymethyl)glutathione dehydrogenase/alcohol dehydrogenase